MIAAIDAFSADRGVATRSNAIEILLTSHPELRKYRNGKGVPA